MFQPYFLELDGKPAGRLFDAQGGNIVADVAAGSGSGLIVRKHLDRVRVTDVVLACGPGMSRAFYDWVGSSFGGEVRAMNCAVVKLDERSKPVGRLDVQRAFVTSLVLPELDKSDGKPGVLMITFKPGMTSMSRSGQKTSLGSYASTVAKTWRTSDFRVKIAGLETACSHISRIQSLNLGEMIVEDAVGDSRQRDLVPGNRTFADVVIEVPRPQAEPFYDWLNDSVAKGNTSSGRQKDGSIDFLAPGSTNPYFTVKLNGLGVVSYTSGSSPSVQIRLYCTEMIFSAGSAAIY